MYLGPMAMPFYQEIGFTEVEVALVTNAFGTFVTISGALIGGLLVHKWGLNINIFYGALLTALTNLPFVYLAVQVLVTWYALSLFVPSVPLAAISPKALIGNRTWLV